MDNDDEDADSDIPKFDKKNVQQQSQPMPTTTPSSQLCVEDTRAAMSNNVNGQSATPSAASSSSSSPSALFARIFLRRISPDPVVVSAHARSHRYAPYHVPAAERFEAEWDAVVPTLTR